MRNKKTKLAINWKIAIAKNNIITKKCNTKFIINNKIKIKHNKFKIRQNKFNKQWNDKT